MCFPRKRSLSYNRNTRNNYVIDSSGVFVNALASQTEIRHLEWRESGMNPSHPIGVCPWSRLR